MGKEIPSGRSRGEGEQTYGCHRCLSEVTVIVDPTGEIAGSGDACHPAVGRSWKEAAYSEEDRKGKGKRSREAAWNES